jgi:hypothetical protein
MKISTVNYKQFICFFLFLTISVGLIPPFSSKLYYLKTIIIPIVFLLSFISRASFKVSKNLYFIIFICMSLITMSFLNSSVELNLVAYSLELIPFFMIVILWQYGITHDMINKGLVFIFILSTFIGALQFLVFPTYYADDLGNWVMVNSELPLLMKRPGSIFGNPNVFGCFNAIFYSWILFAKFFRKKKLFIILVVINIVLIAKSRSSLIAILFIYFFYLYKSGRVKLLLTILVLGILSTSSFLVYVYNNEYADQIFRLSDLVSSDSNSFTIRYDIFKFILDKVNVFHFFGVGPGNIKLYLELFNAPWAGPESAGLHLLLQKGVVFYILYIIFLLTLLLSKNTFNQSILILFLTNGLLETVSAQQQILSILFILLFYHNSKHFLNAI